MTWLGFLVAAALLAITPGPGLAYVVARTVAGGRAEGLASCLGTALGGTVHVIAAAWGLSLLIAQSAVAFGLGKYLGAAYLVYLGLRLLLRRQDARAAAGAATPGGRGVRRAFAEGVLVEVLNVKTALFFLAFLPQFVMPGLSASVAAQLAGLGAVCVALNTAVDVVAVLAAHRLLRCDAARAARARC